MNHVHFKVKTKWCHLCSKGFFRKKNLRDHMISNHQTEDHDVDECEDCITNLKKNERLYQALIAARKRKARREGTRSTTANKRPIVIRKRKVAGIQKVVCKEAHAERGTSYSLNDELIDMHIDMQLLASL